MESNVSETQQVDGSMLEGGGQLFRMSLALSYLLNKSIIITDIRKNRPRGGGLANQHLTCANSLFGLFNAISPNYTLKGNKLKSTELLITSNVASPIRLDSAHPCANTPIVIEQPSVGSINLILQCLLPCLLFQKTEHLELDVRGGTLTSKQPTSVKMVECLFPILRMMGAQTTYEVVSHGIFPDVMGRVSCGVKGLKEG